MKQGQNRFIIVMAVVAGFLGGMLSNQIFQPRAVCAEADDVLGERKQNDKWKVIVAQEFRVVDKYGNKVGSFGIPPDLRDFKAADSPSSEEAYQISQLALGKNERIRMRAGQGFGSIHLKNDEKANIQISTLFGASISLSHKTDDMFSKKGGEIELVSLTPQYKYISLNDAEGNNRVVIGNTKTVTRKTGAQHQHPVSSMILFNENNKVIWEAP
jgi:hypothetical protein